MSDDISAFLAAYPQYAHLSASQIKEAALLDDNLFGALRQFQDDAHARIDDKLAWFRRQFPEYANTSDDQLRAEIEMLAKLESIFNKGMIDE